MLVPISIIASKSQVAEVIFVVPSFDEMIN